MNASISPKRHPLTDAFIVETEELLDDLETGLLELEDRPGDAELLNRIFRTAHTVKGSAGVLGLTPIIDFTHTLEHVLDRLRNRELELSAELNGALLSARDVLADMVRHVADDRDPGLVEARVPCLEFLHAFGTPDMGLEETPRGPEPATAHGERVYRIRMAFHAPIFAQGQDPQLLILELGDLGELLDVQADPVAVPALASLDLYTPLITWTVLLRTCSSTADIDAVFDFVRDDGNITIAPIMEGFDHRP